MHECISKAEHIHSDITQIMQNSPVATFYKEFDCIGGMDGARETIRFFGRWRC